MSINTVAVLLLGYSTPTDPSSDTCDVNDIMIVVMIIHREVRWMNTDGVHRRDYTWCGLTPTIHTRQCERPGMMIAMVWFTVSYCL